MYVFMRIRTYVYVCIRVYAGPVWRLPSGRPTHGRVHSSLPSLRLLLAGRGTTRAEDAQGTPTQRRIPTSVVVYEDN